VLAVRTILVLDGGQPKLHDPTEQREVAELLPVWTLRIVLHAFETVRFPLIGCLGEKIIGAINVYHAIATAAVLALLVTRNALNYF
jgi:hypothetical protein